MIIVKLQGGLGNQMFQYAIGRQLSTLHQTKLKLDRSFFSDQPQGEGHTFRNYELGDFKIKCEYCANQEVNHFSRNDLFSKIIRKFSRIKYLDEKDFGFQPRVFKSGSELYLNGYWQSENYFNEIRTELLSEFTVEQSKLDKANNNQILKIIKESIEKTNSVSVHFRRGDYISNKDTNSFHGTCTNQYYHDAVNFIVQQVKSPHFFLFSDEPEWISKNRLIDNYPSTIVDTKDNHLDMYLMSKCKHNIIANSSFSWWGAWLNQNTEKMVIAPKRWFANEEQNKYTKDLIPQKWIRL